MLTLLFFQSAGKCKFMHCWTGQKAMGFLSLARRTYTSHKGNLTEKEHGLWKGCHEESPVFKDGLTSGEECPWNSWCCQIARKLIRPVWEIVQPIFCENCNITVEFTPRYKSGKAGKIQTIYIYSLYIFYIWKSPPPVLKTSFPVGLAPKISLIPHEYSTMNENSKETNTRVYVPRARFKTLLSGNLRKKKVGQILLSSPNLGRGLKLSTCHSNFSFLHSRTKGWYVIFLVATVSGVRGLMCFKCLFKVTLRSVSNFPTNHSLLLWTYLLALASATSCGSELPRLTRPCGGEEKPVERVFKSPNQ